MAAETIVYTPENGNGSANNVLPWLALNNQRGSIDPALLLAMANGGMGGFGGGGFIWLFFLMYMMQNGFFGNGFGDNGQAFLANQLNNNQGRDYLMQAVQGNTDAIQSMSQSLNCSTSQIQQGINGLLSATQSVGNQVGMSGMQVINSIQSGNADLASKLASGFCDVRNAITTQGYESRLATLQQTDAISAKIAEQTQIINDKFCELEKREMQSKIDALAQQNTILRGTIDNANQTAAIQGFVGAQLAPINAHLTELNREVDDVKCKLPNTVNVQYPNLVAMPQSTAWSLFANGGFGGGFGYGYGNGYGTGFFG